MKGAYYNEKDSYCAQWLRNLIKRQVLPKGEVDERPIEKVNVQDVKGFDQCHWFAGIGVWAYALQKVVIQPNLVWTGSCPCQPFSWAGRGKGFQDKRHLWPIWENLIDKARPKLLFGEQVASSGGDAWLSVVQSDLEKKDYRFGAVALPAGGFGAPHRRTRWYFVAQAKNLGNAYRVRRRTGESNFERNSDSIQPRSFGQKRDGSSIANVKTYQTLNAEWANADWMVEGRCCWPVESGTAFKVIDGTAAYLGSMRAYGNALVAPVAIAFIKAALEVRP